MAHFRITKVLAVLASLAPALTAAQDNSSYVDYDTEPQPSLYEQTVVTPLLSGFPDCQAGPLSNTTACDTSASYYERAQALISLFTLEELIVNTQNNAPGVPRLGLPNYQVWSESLHGLAHNNMSDSGEWNWATSFPQPILSIAGLNRSLINQIGSIISTQARAFNNDGRYGLDSYAPNINGFRAPIWGRGQETPGEDASFLSAAYAYEYITGLQGGVDPEHLKIIATPKHFAGYDIENWNNHSRLGNDVSISQQDLSDYYTPQFLAAARYAKAHSIMCSYNAVNGVPSCSNSFFLQTLLRDSWGFADQGYVSSDCDAIYNVFNPHLYANNVSVASADSMLAGTDIDCGQTYPFYLNESLASGELSRNDIEKSVTRLYTSLMRAGYFDHSTSVYSNLTWSDVETTDSWNVSYEAAVGGIVLLKNDGTLPLASTVKSIALIGPWANATTQMQGNYYGNAPYLTSPLAAFEATGLQINFALGTNISGDSTEGFSDALTAANSSDAIVYIGGIDNTIEAEGLDRQALTWPGNQLDLISQLSEVGKPLIVLQMGGGQVDSSSIKNNTNVGSLIWGGYPGQSGGAAIVDILTGTRAPAGRLVTTQYPADYAEQFSFLDMGLRPNGSNPGQTYIWYSGTPVYQFGDGLFYTTFDETATSSNASNTFDLGTLASAAHPGYAYIEQVPFVNFTAEVTNTGTTASPYTAMIFANTTNAGPAPYPNKWLVGFDRLATITPQNSSTLNIPIPLGALARVDENGDRVLYPGDYELALNNERSVVVKFSFIGGSAVLEKWPLEEQEVLQSE
ncbi:xylan 1,4-beta-xylosidase Talaromyces emersonii [Mollisia scopiformis]|uniref:xylan 1,4-beta-xylosidase n=1 Tax=Mollisia scopiformis TaxID=149040 RepID=A0A194XVN7_MOLSC|nr:xylan 1,4-beta-xylosidase Talaromyces emersonii [Mollisia scopiformis]KUJ23772.1 xylan 1,4-beta-xylosidase Talaromyces emersonii [Mollisia scopiformis]